jgi:hypothetical protein
LLLCNRPARGRYSELHCENLKIENASDGRNLVWSENDGADHARQPF